ncbi:MAG: sulfite oxidase-like oxidoreductase [Chloroflexota bacterium]
MRPWPTSTPRQVESQEVVAPPGQFVTEKFPVLTYGDTPTIDLKVWRFRIFGLVEEEMALSWEDFMGLPQIAVTADFHCVTQWSRLDNLWEGVSFKEVVKLTRVKPEARYVTFHCYGGYTTSLPLDLLMDDDVLFAHRHDGKPLTPEHGGPMRIVVPKRYAWKSAKWVNGLELMAQDKAGFWEQRGYNNNADPWKEERFWDNQA